MISQSKSHTLQTHMIVFIEPNFTQICMPSTNLVFQLSLLVQLLVLLILQASHVSATTKTQKNALSVLRMVSSSLKASADTTQAVLQGTTITSDHVTTSMKTAKTSSSTEAPARPARTTTATSVSESASRGK